jgi:hypothetical protein
MWDSSSINSPNWKPEWIVLARNQQSARRCKSGVPNAPPHKDLTGTLNGQTISKPLPLLVLGVVAALLRRCRCRCTAFFPFLLEFLYTEYMFFDLRLSTVNSFHCRLPLCHLCTLPCSIRRSMRLLGTCFFSPA